MNRETNVHKNVDHYSKNAEKPFGLIKSRIYTISKSALLRLISFMMFIFALPMMVWCLGLINAAALDYPFAGVGCFGSALLYVYSMVTAITGISFAKKQHYYKWCRTLAYIQLIIGTLLIIPLHAYTFLTLPPLFVFTIFYLFATGWKYHKNLT